MEPISLLAGVGGGALAAWLVLRSAAAGAAARAQAQAEQLAASAQRVAEQEALARGAQAALLAEAQRRAAAEAQAARVPALEAMAAEREARLDALVAELAAARAQATALEARQQEERAVAADRLALVEDARSRLEAAFKALSADALRANNEAFLTLANEALSRFQQGAKGELEGRQTAIAQLVQPLAETLGRLDGKLGEIEKARATEAGGMAEQLRQLQAASERLGRETHHLVEALRRPAVRGRWGEVQLRRVVEMAGMVEHCDFLEQAVGDDGALRPDLVIRLPGGRQVVVDAKAVLSAYLEAIEAADDERRLDRLRAHARQLADHVDRLGAKQYWQQFQPAPEFVVLFVPGEAVLAAACEQRPELMEYATSRRVILATPSSLIATLLAVAFGWRQEHIARNAQEISDLGRELHERLRVLVEHFAAIGDGLDRAVRGYNKAVGSFESRVLVAARRFRDLGAAGGEPLPPLAPSEAALRTLSAAE